MLGKTKRGCVELNRVWCTFVVSGSLRFPPFTFREKERWLEQCKWQNHAPNTIHFLSKDPDTPCVLYLSHWDISWPVWRAVKCGKSHTSYFWERALFHNRQIIVMGCIQDWGRLKVLNHVIELSAGQRLWAQPVWERYKSVFNYIWEANSVYL